MFCNFLLQLNMAKRRHEFLAHRVLKPNYIPREVKPKLEKNKTRFDL